MATRKEVRTSRTRIERTLKDELKNKIEKEITEIASHADRSDTERLDQMMASLGKLKDEELKRKTKPLAGRTCKTQEAEAGSLPTS